ncbi:thioesterase [Mycobacterium colombiense]|uniref:PaaI family thioesterase n=1 Tax=Mycobacterium colombiense TaxID=339268 RepID=UPI00096C186D|nr:PaaI family thioesterase [Mycobacterium colombiense]OMB94549.1 thioesterase [Mycobacterium colombiense]OMC29733.1 thioesterase [Mycobacterium colombiense]
MVADDNGDCVPKEYESLARSVRRLIDVTIRTEVDVPVVAVAKAHVERAVEQLSEALMPGSFGVRRATDGQPMVSGNVAIGTRNPIAPPLVINHDADGVVWTEVVLGAAYEGPPGHVHGGVCALILDHVLGATAHQPGRPAYTGTLSLRYERPTPLGLVRASAYVEHISGAKTFAAGHIADSTGMTVTAEGVFIVPKGAPR